MLGNTTRGKRSKLNNANETNALSAVKILFSDDKTYVANVVMHTWKKTDILFLLTYHLLPEWAQMSIKYLKLC